MPTGWVRHHRKEQSSAIWEKPPLYLKVWNWLKLNVDRESGEITTTAPIIADKVQWVENNRPKVPDRKTIRDILNFMAYEKMIEKQVIGTRNAQYLRISLCNWSTYNPLVDEAGNVAVTSNKRQLDGCTRSTTSTTHIDTRGGADGTSTTKGYDVRALKAWERWNELQLPLPESIPVSEHMEGLTRLFTGRPKPWRPTQVDEAMQKLVDEPEEFAWVATKGPGYLAHRPRGHPQVIEQVLTKKARGKGGGSPGRETADERADRLMAEMEAEDARAG